MSSRTSRALLALTLSSTLLIAACGGDDSSTTTCTSTSTGASAAADPADLVDEPTVSLPAEIPTDLVITDITEGEGEAADEGSTVYVYYVGVLTQDGKRFDGNYGGDPFAVTLGTGAVIDGWDQGLIGVKNLPMELPDLAMRFRPTPPFRSSLMRWPSCRPLKQQMLQRSPSKV
jgi:hypothetical protein